MVGIGLRVTAKEVFYAIVENSHNDGDDEIISISKIKLSPTMNEPERLENLRNTLISLFDQYAIERAAIKVIEGNANSKINESIIFRLNIEGVIKEVIASNSIKEYLIGRANNVSALLGCKCKKVVQIADELGLDEIKTDDNKVLNDNYKEALVVAIAILRR